ncbi:hypothetical protein KI387_017995, partial [Taxus chinensis]
PADIDDLASVFCDSQTFSHSVSDRRRSTSVDANLHQSTPIYISRRRFYMIDADHPAG